MLKSYLKIFAIIIPFLTFSNIALSLSIVQEGKANGSAMVFIPGLSTHGDLWRDWVEKYKADYTIYIVTAPGFAGEPARTGNMPFLKSTVAEIAHALAEDKVKDAVVIGHSIGGLMSLMLAREHPELVGSVVVVDSLPFLAGLFMPGTSPEAAKTRAGYLGDQMKAMPHKAFITSQIQGLPILSNTASFLPTLEGWTKASDQGTIAKAISETLSMDYRAALAAIKVPITVVVAYSTAMPFARDQLKQLFTAQYALLEGVKIELVDDSFHFIMIDQPTVFSALLENHINKLKE